MLNLSARMPNSKLDKFKEMEWYSIQNEDNPIRMQWNSSESTRNVLEMNNENLVFQQNDLFPSAFPIMADIRRQGKLCDVVLKVFNTPNFSQFILLSFLIFR